MPKIDKILVANRGEIAVRIIGTAHRLGITTVAIYTENDKKSLHLIEADEAICLPGTGLAETYLNIQAILDVAKNTGCDAIHPGYGFLSENPLFPEACENTGIIFIGPRAEVMKTMGNKIAARNFALNAGVPVMKGLTGDPRTLFTEAGSLGLPVLIKPATGGGGKGMQIVNDYDGLEEALEATSRQALAYFGDNTIYLEKYLYKPRHIEFQILGDNHGNVIHLFERECSIQRRYQKIIEESPSPTLTDYLRSMMGEAAVKIGRMIGYTGAGTIEFLVDKDLNYYFLEMNTRIQVEHPVTEMVTGIDIVEEQIHIAEGYPLRLGQQDINQCGHAIECRIYAEDPEQNFIPSPGTMTLYHEPEMENIRIDKGVTPESEITTAYDPMICKLISVGDNREEAAVRMYAALSDYVIHGIKTNIPYLITIVRSKAFLSNVISTNFCDENGPALSETIRKEREDIPTYLPPLSYLAATLQNNLSAGGKGSGVWERVGYWREHNTVVVNDSSVEHHVGVRQIGKSKYDFSYDGKGFRFDLVQHDRSKITFRLDEREWVVWHSTGIDAQGHISVKGHTFDVSRKDFLPETITHIAGNLKGRTDEVHSPMPGIVIKLFAEPGQRVKKGEPLLIIEAMKMENYIYAPVSGIIEKVNITKMQRVDPGLVLLILKEDEESEND